jgi:5-formyltetrahydrofolate cyclo-ligase
LFYPVIIESNKRPKLASVIVDDETLFKSNKYGIDEPVDGIDMIPSEIDMVIVPLLSMG